MIPNLHIAHAPTLSNTTDTAQAVTVENLGAMNILSTKNLVLANTRQKSAPSRFSEAAQVSQSRIFANVHQRTILFFTLFISKIIVLYFQEKNIGLPIVEGDQWWKNSNPCPINLFILPFF